MVCVFVQLYFDGPRCRTLLGRHPFATREPSSALGAPVQLRATRTNDGRPSAYMLTAVSRPHPGNDCVINPQPFLKLLLTAEGEDGINCLRSPVTDAAPRTVWVRAAISHCHSWAGGKRGWGWGGASEPCDLPAFGWLWVFIVCQR